MAGCYVKHTSKGDKRTFNEPEKGKMFPYKLIKPAQAVWALCLLVRKCSKPKVHSYATKWRPKDCIHETAFSNTDLHQPMYTCITYTTLLHRNFLEEKHSSTFNICCCLVAKSCLTLSNSTDCSTPCFPVLHYLLQFVQIHIH